MRTDRTTKVLLSIIALGIWALTITQVGTPLAGAESISSQQAAPPSDTQMRAITPGPATLPLRWRVSYAAVLTSGLYNTYCTSAVVIQNFSEGTLTYQLEWSENTGASLGHQENFLTSGQSTVWVANSTLVKARPITGGSSSGLADFVGYATVHADDPRLQASSYLVCRDATGTNSNIVSITAIPTTPVGATMEYFQADVPGT